MVSKGSRTTCHPISGQHSTDCHIPAFRLNGAEDGITVTLLLHF